MEMPKPTEHHERLKVMAGSWTAEETMMPSPWDPKGGTATAYCEQRIDLDGMVLITNYRQERDGNVTYRGHGVIGYDAKNERYTMYWFDSMSHDPGGAAHGKWEGDTLMFEMKSEMGSSRYIYDFAGPNEYEFRIEMSQDGQNFAPWMTSTYKRA